MRFLSFNFHRNIPTIKDFIGYPQITPPEWYFLMEDVFCEESIKVMYQFLRSQLNDNSFLSYDGKLNYSEDQKNITLPIYSIIGTKDTLAPPESIQHHIEMIQSENNKRAEFDQGHIGMIMHPKTVRKICETAHEWIGTLE